MVLKSLAILSPYGLWGLHRQREDSRDLEKEERERERERESSII